MSHFHFSLSLSISCYFLVFFLPSCLYSFLPCFLFLFIAMTWQLCFFAFVHAKKNIKMLHLKGSSHQCLFCLVVSCFVFTYLSTIGLPHLLEVRSGPHPKVGVQRPRAPEEEVPKLGGWGRSQMFPSLCSARSLTCVSACTDLSVLAPLCFPSTLPQSVVDPSPSHEEERGERAERGGQAKHSVNQSVSQPSTLPTRSLTGGSELPCALASGSRAWAQRGGGGEESVNQSVCQIGQSVSQSVAPGDPDRGLRHCVGLR